MTEGEKEQIICCASDVWLVWHWINKTKVNFALLLPDPEDGGKEKETDIWGVRHLLSVASKKIGKIMDGDGGTTEEESDGAMAAVLCMRTVSAWLDGCMDGVTSFTIKKSEAESLLGVVPGRYRLADIKKIGHRVTERLYGWSVARSREVKTDKASICPFCGGPAQIRRGAGRYGVQCARIETCGATAYFDTESESSAETVGAWIKRRSKQSILSEDPIRGPFFNTMPGTYPETLKRIRPCPFCGSLNVSLARLDSKNGPSGVMRCGVCEMSMLFRSADGPEGMMDVIDRWNRRDGEKV